MATPASPPVLTSDPKIDIVYRPQSQSASQVSCSQSPPPASSVLSHLEPQSYTHTVQAVTAPTEEKDQRKCWFQKKSKPGSAYKDPWFAKDIEKYPIGYPSLAAYVSADIDARIYRRFSCLRNRLLLHMQDKLCALEQELDDIDRDDEKEAQKGHNEPLWRLISRRYNERTASISDQKNVNTSNQQTGNGTNQQNGSIANPQKNNATRRMEVLISLEATLEKYDDLLLREHEICSIKGSTTKQRASFANFIWNGKKCGNDKRPKHLAKQENEYIYRKDDSIILGTQEDAWLGTAVESMKHYLPKVVKRYLLSTAEDRKKSDEAPNTEYLSNERINRFVKAVVCAASTVLLVLPVVILYVLSTHGASGGLKIGVMLIFVVAFALVLATMTNASRSEMFGGSAGYTAVLIVFLTFTG